jgi:hypothetical protein
MHTRYGAYNDLLLIVKAPSSRKSRRELMSKTMLYGDLWPGREWEDDKNSRGIMTVNLDIVGGRKGRKNVAIYVGKH